LSLDKTVELARFATVDDEGELVRWSANVSSAAVRRRADRSVRPNPDDVEAIERARSLSWWWLDGGQRLGLAGELPAAQGAVVVKALERTVERIPAMPDEDAPWHADARRADALVALCSASIAADPDADRATVVLHAHIDATGALTENEIERGPRFRDRRPNGSSVMPEHRSCSRTRAERRWAWDERRVSPRRGSCGGSATATEAAGSPAAGRTRSRTPITSDGGAEAEVPTSTT
jgi:hypothetical protein